MRSPRFLVTAAAILALSACTTSRHPRAQTTVPHSVVVERPSTANQSTIGADDLYANAWILSDIEVGARARPVSDLTAAAFTVRFEPYQMAPDGFGVSDGECDNSAARVTSSRIQVTQSWTNLLVLGNGCTNDPHDPDTHAVLGVLSGTVTWAIRNRQLTITNSRSGTLRFTTTH